MPAHRSASSVHALVVWGSAVLAPVTPRQRAPCQTHRCFASSLSKTCCRRFSNTRRLCSRACWAASAAAVECPLCFARSIASRCRVMLPERRDVGLGEGVAFVHSQSSHLRCTLSSIVLDNLGTASQADGRAWPAFAGCPIGRDCKLGVLDARQVFNDLLAITGPHVDAVQKASSIHVTAILSCSNL